MKRIVAVYRFFMKLGRRRLKLIRVGYLLPAFYFITLSLQTGNHTFLFVPAMQGFVWCLARDWYKLIYQPYELRRLLSKVDFEVMDRTLNEYAKRCNVEFLIECALPDKVRAESLPDNTAGTVLYSNGTIILDPGKTISESVDRELDAFLLFLKTLIHEQIHLGFKIRNEGVVEQMSRELLVDYIMEAVAVDEVELQRVLDSFKSNHSYNIHIAKMQDRVEELRRDYDLDSDQARRSIVGFLAGRETISALVGNNMPPAKKVARHCGALAQFRPQ